MRQLTSFFNYSTDLVLATFLLLLLMFGFVIATSMTPLALPEPETQAVLGTETGCPVSLTGGLDSVVSATIETDSSRLFESILTIDSSQLGLYSNEFLLIDQADSRGLYRIELELPEQSRYAMKYGFAVAGQEYVMYDDAGDALQRDFEIEVEPQQEVPVMLQLEAYEQLNYPIEILMRVEYLGLSGLP